jgi:hypothetical protein
MHARRAGSLSLEALLALLAVLAASGCRIQRWPGPMRPTVLPLPGGEDAAEPPGLEEIVAVRHSAPVSVRQWGSPSAYPLDRSHAKERVRAGGWVLSGAGARAEVLWPLEPASVELIDAGVAAVGERSRDEPALKFLSLTRAKLYLVPGMRIALPGGATVAGDPSDPSGPFVLEFIEPNLIRVDNQAKVSAYVAFREEVLTLGPGQQVDLGLLEIGTAPLESRADLRLLAARGERGTLLEGLAEGGLESRADGAGLAVVARTRGALDALGVRIRLEAGEAALLWALDAPRPAALSAPEAGTGVQGSAAEAPVSEAAHAPVEPALPPVEQPSPPVEQPSPPVEQPSPPVEQPSPPVEGSSPANPEPPVGSGEEPPI